MKGRKVPRGTFWIGALVAVALGVPLTCLGLQALARTVAVGDPALPLDRILLISIIFSGFPAFLSGGGVARLVAHRLMERVVDGRSAGAAPLGRALLIAAGAMGLAGIGLAVLTAVPLGGMPEQPVRWAWIAGAGLVCGALTGLALGVLVGMRLRRHSLWAGGRRSIDAPPAQDPGSRAA